MNYSLLVRLSAIYTSLLLASCHFQRPHNTSDVYLSDERMDETSGIAASAAHPGYLYVHNDSGDSSRFFAITPDGQLKGIFYFKGDSSPLGVKDCEDITLGSGPDSGASYVYMGDIGDNFVNRKFITIYRIKEPALLPASQHVDVDADPLYLRYPDGPRDAETLMADPIDKLLYIISKREDSVHVYSTPLYFKAHDTVTLTKKTSIYLNSIKGRWITSGDIAPKGDQVLVKSYTKVFYWRRFPGEHIWQTLQRRPTALPYLIEGQGEAICFTPDETGYYTISEGPYPRLFYYKVPHFIVAP
ncbi:MAG TPA: hypothetical protein VHC48_21385 [Puia sp.]|nr:hypothetical protein [Puia sp.]